MTDRAIEITVPEYEDYQYASGRSLPVRWRSAPGNPGPIRVDVIHPDQSEHPIIQDGLASGVASVALPAEWAHGAGYKVRVSGLDASGAEIVDFRSFSIGGSNVHASPTLELTAPPAATQLRAGDTCSVAWRTKAYRGTVRVALRYNKQEILVLAEAGEPNGEVTFQVDPAWPANHGHDIVATIAFRYSGVDKTDLCDRAFYIHRPDCTCPACEKAKMGATA